MEIYDLHEWEVSPAQARQIQLELRQQVRIESPLDLEGVRSVAGVDNAYLKRGAVTVGFAVVALFSFPELELLETQFARCDIGFPYIPGLLTFREGLPILAACRKLTRTPDLFIFDGQGYAHPVRFGLASHLGLLLGQASLGCAKSRLVGNFTEPGRDFGAAAPLVDGENGEVIGAALRTHPPYKPVFVSPGHKCDLSSAVEIVLGCCRLKSRLPEPARLAHRLVTEQRRAYAARNYGV